MAKLGRDYELVLFEIVRALEPSASVSQGKWIDGPDGAREVDVMIERTVPGKTERFLFECKDYSKKKRIGIGTVDAFESKLKDLGASGVVLTLKTGPN